MRSDRLVQRLSCRSQQCVVSHPNSLRTYPLTRSNTQADFPSRLYDVELCYTNLRELPDNLDSKWLLGMMICIEYGQLTSVPSVLIRLMPYSLVLTGNPINELPPELFQIEDMLCLSIGSTKITELPRNVTSFSPLLSSIYMTHTNVSSFWSWINPLLNRTADSSSSLLVGHSPYCTDLGKIMSGDSLILA
ncbi:unnamed protein product [Phytophthora lilii]|uniref:Unnamed protein product n=1 Tax=Phytophthora lilii TaxID=2077276 RepID=A0A9W6TVV6_9STRA|nr:unnamed protein product [Phytophthora lilii]